MHQVTVIEPKWLSEVAPTFFRVADQNKISKRKASEKIEPLFDRFATDKDAWVSLQLATGGIDLTLFIASQQAETRDAVFADLWLIGREDGGLIRVTFFVQAIQCILARDFRLSARTISELLSNRIPNFSS